MLARNGFPVTVVEQHEIPEDANSFDRAEGKYIFEIICSGALHSAAKGEDHEKILFPMFQRGIR